MKYKSQILGNWVENIENLNIQFNTSNSLRYIIIDNFLNNEYAEKVYNEFPTDYENWHKYYNPIEVKYANNKIYNMGNSIKNVFDILSNSDVVNIFENISDISNLEIDPYLHGSGLHAHPRYGRLGMHLDYEKHPILKNKQRRLNLILYLSKDWKDEWNGATELWDKEMNKCIVKSNVKFNRAILFKTNDISWHGIPERIMCPEGVYRNSLAYYYISPLISKENSNKFGNDGTGFRTKASFIKRPQDPNLSEMDELYNIRPYRRIEKEDMDSIWPKWTPELF